MYSNTLQTTQQGTLADLAIQINSEHRQAEEALNTSLQHALRAGQLLLEAKGLCSHGTWLPWLKENPRGAPLQGQAILYFGDNGKEFTKEFSKFGPVLLH